MNLRHIHDKTIRSPGKARRILSELPTIKMKLHKRRNVFRILEPRLTILGVLRGAKLLAGWEPTKEPAPPRLTVITTF